MAQTGPAQVGVPVTKASLNAKYGGAMDGIRKGDRALQELTDWAAPYGTADLVALYGFTDEEADLFLSGLRGATEAPALHATVEGFQFANRGWGA